MLMEVVSCAVHPVPDSDQLHTGLQERRSALECWGFQCKCLRCRNETEERKYHVKDMSSHDKQASAWLQTFDEWLKRKLRYVQPFAAC